MVIEVEAFLTWWPAHLEVEVGTERPEVELTLDQRIALPAIWKQDEIEAGGTLVVEVTITYAGSSESRDCPADSPEYDVTEVTIELTDDDETFVLDLTPAQLAALDLSSNADFGTLVIEAMNED